MSEGIKVHQATLTEILETIAEVFDLRSHVIHERYDEIDDWETKAALADSRAAAIREAINALATLQREADGMREALQEIVSRYEAKSDMTDDEGIAWHARARAALNGSPQEKA
jgi:vesicle coat complex subunit